MIQLTQELAAKLAVLFAVGIFVIACGQSAPTEAPPAADTIEEAEEVDAQVAGRRFDVQLTP